jgi:hypothetical protein
VNFTDAWKQLLSRNAEIEGGTLIHLDGSPITSAKLEAPEKMIYCASMVALAEQLSKDANRGEWTHFILEGERGYLIMIPFLEKAIFAVLATKRAKSGLLLLEMQHAIDAWFGPGLVTEPIFRPRSPKRGSGYAKSS